MKRVRQFPMIDITHHGDVLTVHKWLTNTLGKLESTHAVLSNSGYSPSQTPLIAAALMLRWYHAEWVKIDDLPKIPQNLLEMIHSLDIMPAINLLPQKLASVLPAGVGLVDLLQTANKESEILEALMPPLYAYAKDVWGVEERKDFALLADAGKERQDIELLGVTVQRVVPMSWRRVLEQDLLDICVQKGNPYVVELSNQIYLYALMPDNVPCALCNVDDLEKLIGWEIGVLHPRQITFRNFNNEETVGVAEDWKIIVVGLDGFPVEL